MKKTRHHAASSVALAAVGLGLATSGASAVNVKFMGPQNLGSRNAYAGAYAYYPANFVIETSDHSACPGVAQGYSGYTSTPNSGGRITHWTNCAPGESSWYFNNAGEAWRGAVFNSTYTWTDYISSAYIQTI